MADETLRPVAFRRFVPLGILVIAGALFVMLGGRRYLSFAALAENREWLCDTVARTGVKGVSTFVLAYACMAALSIPGAAVFTLAAGFLFGPWLGTAYALIGATIGATMVFLAARAGLGGLAARAGPWVHRVETGFRRNGLNYLVVLRLIPIIPFWLINLVAGAIGLRLWVFVLGTFVGMIPVSFIYASLGNGLGTLAEEGRPPDLAVLFSPSVILPILGLAALALAPVLYRRWRFGDGAA